MSVDFDSLAAAVAVGGTSEDSRFSDAGRTTAAAAAANDGGDDGGGGGGEDVGVCVQVEAPDGYDRKVRKDQQARHQERERHWHRKDDSLEYDDDGGGGNGDFAFMSASRSRGAGAGRDRRSDTGGTLGNVGGGVGVAISDSLVTELDNFASALPDNNNAAKTKSKRSRQRQQNQQNQQNQKQNQQRQYGGQKRQRPATAATAAANRGRTTEGSTASFLDIAADEQGTNNNGGGGGGGRRSGGMSSVGEPIPKKNRSESEQNPNGFKLTGVQGNKQGRRNQNQSQSSYFGDRQQRKENAGGGNSGKRQQQQQQQRSGAGWQNTRGDDPNQRGRQGQGQVGSLGRVGRGGGGGGGVARLPLPNGNQASIMTVKQRKIEQSLAEDQRRSDTIAIDDDDDDNNEHGGGGQVEESFVGLDRPTDRRSIPPGWLKPPQKNAPKSSAAAHSRKKKTRSSSSASASAAASASASTSSSSLAPMDVDVVDIVSTDDENDDGDGDGDGDVSAASSSKQQKQKKKKESKKQKKKGGAKARRAKGYDDDDDDDDDDEVLVNDGSDDDDDDDDDEGSPSLVAVAADSSPLPRERAGKKKKRKKRTKPHEQEQAYQSPPPPTAGTGSPSKDWNRSPLFADKNDSSSSSDSDDALRPSYAAEESKTVSTTSSSSSSPSTAAAAAAKSTSTTAMPKGGKKAAAAASSSSSRSGISRDSNMSSVRRRIEESSEDDSENDPPPLPPSRSPSAAAMTKKKDEKAATPPTSTSKTLGGSVVNTAEKAAQAAQRIAGAGVSAVASVFGGLTRGGSSKKAKPVRPGCSRNPADHDSINSYSSDEDNALSRQADRRSREDAKSGRSKQKKVGSGKKKKNKKDDTNQSNLLGWREGGGDHTTPTSRNRQIGISSLNFHRQRGSASASNRGKTQIKMNASSAPFPRRNNRRTSRQKKKNEVICIDSSESEPEEAEFNMTEEEQLAIAKSNSLQEQGSPPRVRKFGERYKISAVRIAVGKKVFAHGCELSFQPGTASQFIRISFKVQVSSGGRSRSSEGSSDEKVEVHTIGLDSITEMKYFIADDDDTDEGEGQDKAKSALVSDESDSEPMSFLALRVDPNDKNGLASYSNSYLQKEDKATSKDVTQRKYLVVELRSNEAFNEILHHMRNNETLGAFLGDSSQLQSQDVGAFNAALIEDDKKDRRNRLSSIASSRKRSTRSSTRAKEAFSSGSENKTLLVYPFEAEENVFETAGKRLREVGGKVITGQDEENGSPIWGHPGAEQTSQASTDEATGSMGRTHYLTIRSEDMDRLEPGEFLNDTLIDFFMRWISRKKTSNESNVHFFTSHFFTTLQEEGVDAVTSWTAKKNINIFDKKFIFLPINESLHWSLCVVVNPGHIGNWFMDEKEQSDDDDCPCILFLDSLKAHRKARVAAKVRLWLNAEAKRLKKFEALRTEKPFHKESMQVIDPKVPYQDNSWDCGVFVCRYAYSLFLLRNNRITYKDFDEKFRNAITRRPEFKFGMNDIGRMRRELKDLVDNLSVVYLSLKEKEARKKRARKEEKARKAEEEKKAAMEEGGEEEGEKKDEGNDDEEMAEAEEMAPEGGGTVTGSVFV